MSTITPHYRTIKELLQARSFAIDEYQREYKWERSNIEELVNDLQSTFENNFRDGDAPGAIANYGNYFLGSIIVTKRDSKSYLVDGQQRVSSLTLLLIHLFRAAVDQQLEVADDLKPLIYSNHLGVKKFNLDIPERVPAIQALFDGEEFTVDGQDESVQNIVSRYEDIRELDLASEMDGHLEVFIYWLIEKVGLIEIATDSDEHAYAIFETMNDRGKPLSPVDMLKAYLLAPITDTEARAEANRTWKRTVLELNSWGPEPEPERDAAFSKAWLRAQYATTIRERRAGSTDKDWEIIGTAFHRWVRDNSSNVGVGDSGGNQRMMTREMPFFSRAYRLVLDASLDYKAGLEPVFYNAHNDFTWQNTVLLAPLAADDDDETVRKKIAATATYLDIWMMRRTVNYTRVGYSAVNYAMFLLSRDIRRLNLDHLIDTLYEKLEDDEKDFSLEGSENRGRAGIRDLGLNQFSKRYIFHLLARVTSFVEVGSGGSNRFAEYVDRRRKNAYDIEHIWADVPDRYADEFTNTSEFYTWRDNAAGLLLLPADVNRSLQHRPYEYKVDVYSRQNRYAASLSQPAYQHQPQFTRFITEQALPFTPHETFGREQQLQRRELLLKLAQRIWSPERLEEYRP